MKNLFLPVLLLTLVLSACEERIGPANCDELTPDHVISWIDELDKGEAREYYFIYTSTYKGEQIFITDNYLAHGVWFCGVGMEFSDMYLAFDCKGHTIDGLNFENVGEFVEWYNNYEPPVVEEKDPS